MLPIDVEAEVVALLNAALAEPVATRVPTPRPTGGYVRVTRAGGNATNVLQSAPRLLVECWDATSASAFALARTAYGLLVQAYGTAGAWGGRASLTEPVNFPDPDTDSPRYQFVATILTDLA